MILQRGELLLSRQRLPNFVIVFGRYSPRRQFSRSRTNRLAALSDSCFGRCVGHGGSIAQTTEAVPHQQSGFVGYKTDYIGWVRACAKFSAYAEFSRP